MNRRQRWFSIAALLTLALLLTMVALTNVAPTPRGVYAASAVDGLSGSPASAAQTASQPNGPRLVAKSGGGAPDIVIDPDPPTLTPSANTLYNQYDNISTIVTNSQNYEAANDAFDDFVADDFVVPSGQTWSVSEIDIEGGLYSGSGTPVSFNVFFYANGAGNLPGAQVAARTSLAYSTVLFSPTSYLIPLSAPVSLVPGTYWVSVQANLDAGANDTQWGWQDRITQSNSGAALGEQYSQWGRPGPGLPTAGHGDGRYGNPDPHRHVRPPRRLRSDDDPNPDGHRDWPCAHQDGHPHGDPHGDRYAGQARRCPLRHVVPA